MKHKIQTIDADGNQMFITIRLDDECKNGHQDFAITGNIYEAGKPCTDRNNIAGGCIHDEIMAARPDLKPFIDLHLSDCEGVPMYAVENGFYFLKKGFNDTKPDDDNFKAEFCDYYRVTPEQFEALNQCKTQIQYAIAIQSLGILEQWKAQATEAIKALETMTGEIFVNTSVKSQFHAPTPKQIDEENAKIASGYYTAKAETQRRQATLKQQIAGLKADAQAKNQNVRDETNLKIQVLRIGGQSAFKNCIVYNHTKTMAFNWLSYETPVDQRTIDKITAAIKWPDGYSLKADNA